MATTGCRWNLVGQVPSIAPSGPDWERGGVTLTRLNDGDRFRNERYFDAAISPLNKLVAAASQRGELRVWNQRTGDLLGIRQGQSAAGVHFVRIQSDP